MAMTKRLWSINAIATELGLDRRTVGRRLGSTAPDGAIRGKPGWYLDNAVRALNLTAPPAADGLDLNAERARREKAAADRLEMQNAQMRGELLARPDVDAAVIEDYSRVRARLLNIPAKLAPHLVGIAEPRIADATVRTAIHEALRELSDPDAMFDAPTHPGDGDDDEQEVQA